MTGERIYYFFNVLEKLSIPKSLNCYPEIRTHEREGEKGINEMNFILLKYCHNQRDVKNKEICQLE